MEAGVGISKGFTASMWEAVIVVSVILGVDLYMYIQIRLRFQFTLKKTGCVARICKWQDYQLKQREGIQGCRLGNI